MNVRMNVSVYDRADNFVRTITPAQLLVFVHTDELNGEDSVHISTLAPLAQGERPVSYTHLTLPTKRIV